MSNWLALLLLLLFLALWAGISLFLSWLGGWRELSRHYRATRPFDGARFHMRYGKMQHGVWYRSMLTVGADASSLFVAVIPPWRFGHPALLIPWDDISVSRKRLLFDMTTFRFRLTPDVPLVLFTKLARRLLANAPARLAVA